MGVTGIHKSSSRAMPKGVFFFVGPTGVGKTELSKSLAKFLFGDETACIRFDMSEYSQENSDQKLIGAPPGYVGFEEGGQLTNAIRERPFSVVLFDEIEKAAKPNPRILDIFLQILEDGRLTDNRGETTYFSDTVIIFTSNLGTSEVRSGSDPERVAGEFVRIVKEYFDNELKRPEILGRIGYENIVPFNFINDPAFADKILKSKMEPVKLGIREKYGMELEIEDWGSFSAYILSGADVSKGGRDILNALDSRLLTPMAMRLFDNYDDLGRLRGSRLIAFVRDDGLDFRFE
jgi:ATP-dependent Clp protease ATP-binding subunit ClpA